MIIFMPINLKTTIWSSTCHEGTGNIWGNKSKNKYAQPNMPALEHKQEIFAYGNEIEQQ